MVAPPTPARPTDATDRMRAAAEAATQQAAIARMEAKYQAKRRAAQRERDAIARMEARLQEKRRTYVDGRPTSGPGWKILSNPAQPHAELEARAKRLFAAGWHQIPWPQNWIVRWAELRGGLFDVFTIILGLCIAEHRLILISERNNRARSEQAVDETSVHELVHALHGREEAHGERFATTLSRVKEFLFPNPEATVAGRAGGAP
jgi:hypothetical protein